MNNDLHDGMPEKLSLFNISDGALPEIIDRELERVAENLNDQNTSDKARRSIIIKLDFVPFKDRGGAEVALNVKTQLAGVKAVESTMYTAKRNGQWHTYAKNHKQTEMQFGMRDAVTEADKKAAN